jgi:hypothetical protein
LKIRNSKLHACHQIFEWQKFFKDLLHQVLPRTGPIINNSGQSRTESDDEEENGCNSIDGSQQIEVEHLKDNPR